MMRASVVIVPFLAGALASAPRPMVAQQSSTDMAIAVRFGTQGIGGELSKWLVPHIGVRVGGEAFSLNVTGTQTDISYKTSVKLHSFNALLDLYPGPRGSFHLTAGLVTNPVTAEGTGQPSGSGTISINDHEYTPAQVGTLSAKIKFASAAPYLGLGFGTAANKGSGIFFAFDLGVRIGKPTLALSATGASGNPQLAADVTAQQTKTQNDVNRVFGWPVLALGLGYRF
jgi:hypothetical protein